MNFNEREKKILKFWQDEKVFEKTLEKTKDGESFVFYDGPITVNAKPGIHHVEARIYKDIIPRYKTMQGFHVRRKNGWDTHGLPVELEVEKKLGFKSKKDIEDYGIAKFNQECKKTVDELIPVFRQMTERIGYWVDMDDPYITYKPEYIESLWWLLKQIWDRGLLYEDFKVVPWCPRCGTGLSSHELALGYQKVQENSVYIKLRVSENQKIKDINLNKNTYLLSWTTTPWTLPGNVALAVGPDMDYVLAKKDEDSFILAKSRLSVLGENYEILKQFKGKDVEGLNYEPLFDIKDLQNKHSHAVYPASFVTEEDGTGIVHTAVMYGADDFELGQKYNLPKIHTVTQQGFFNSLVEGFEGKKVKDKETERSLIEYLKKKNLLFKEETISHDYPFCWRCKEPLLYYAKESWFIKVTEVQDKLLKSNEKINWMPEHLKEGRFGEWLRGVKDWAITRERYWGTPFPVWRCSSCDKTLVVGSFKELEELSHQELKDPHRPHVDEISFKCPSCGKEMKREPYVIDVWFDSGAMPFAQYHFPFKQDEKIENLPFPAEYISEAIDQTRGWFYTLLAVSVLLGYDSPYKNILCLGHVVDKKGEKMSKSKGNIVVPDEIIEKYGVDALRWYFFTVNQPDNTKRFDESEVKKALMKLLLLENIFKFLNFYLDEFDKINLKEVQEIEPSHLLDKWLLVRLKSVQAEVSQKLDEFEVVKAARLIEEFIGEISYKYIHWSRDRFKKDSPQRKETLLVLIKVVLEIDKLIAPFTPFMAENIYQELKKLLKKDSLKQSVHLEDWPVKQELTPEDKQISETISFLGNLISLGLRARKVAEIKVRQPLSEIKLNHDFKDQKDTIFKILEKELNVKKVVFDKKINEKKGWILEKEGSLSVLLDTDISPELKEEGELRELTRHIQSLRKKGGFVPQDKATLLYDQANKKLSSLIEKHASFLKKHSGLDGFGAFDKEVDLKKEILVMGESTQIGLEKV